MGFQGAHIPAGFTGTQDGSSESPVIREASMPPSGGLEKLGGEQKGSSVGLSRGLTRGNQGPWEAKSLLGRMGGRSGNRKVSPRGERWY